MIIIANMSIKTTNYEEINNLISEKGIIDIISNYEDDVKRIKKINKIFKTIKFIIRSFRNTGDIDMSYFIFDELFKILDLKRDEEKYTISDLCSLLKTKVMDEGIDKLVMKMECEEMYHRGEASSFDDEVNYYGDIGEIFYDAQEEQEAYEHHLSMAKVLMVLIKYCKMI